MNKFTNAFYQADTDKGHAHQYDVHYAEIFKDYEPNSLMEIGIMFGNSLAAWKLAFPNCDITGLDITDKRIKSEYITIANAKTIIGNSTKSEIRNIVTNSYDVIVDDGSHFYKDIIKTWHNFHDKFNYAYVIEDVMYEKQSIIDAIKQYGYENIKIYPSARQGIPVNANFLKEGVYGDSSESITINLYMIVIYKD